MGTNSSKEPKGKYSKKYFLLYILNYKSDIYSVIETFMLSVRIPHEKVRFAIYTDILFKSSCSLPSMFWWKQIWFHVLHFVDVKYQIGLCKLFGIGFRNLLIVRQYLTCLTSIGLRIILNKHQHLLTDFISVTCTVY